MNIIESVVVHTYMKIFKFVTFLIPFHWPKLFSEENPTDALIKHIASQGHKKVLLVTDNGLVKLGIIEKITKLLSENSIQYHLFDGVEPDPTILQIEAGATICINNGCDAILAIGGGSPIDAAKMIGAKVKNNKPIRKMAGLLRVFRGMLPLYAIPTTSGTGAECTIAAVVSDPENRAKFAVMDFKLLPKAAAIDPQLIVGLPPSITAATGMDALTHAVEAYISRNALARTDELALDAVKLIMNNLERAFHNGSDVEARKAMGIASHKAGKAFTQAGVGYVHGFAHKIGGLYHVPHGLANAIIMPYVLDYSIDNCTDRLATLAICSGLGSESDDKKTLALAFIARIREMNKTFGIPDKIEKLVAKDIESIAKSAINEARFTYAVPRYMSMQQAHSVISQLMA